jgi:hypothetical protein
MSFISTVLVPASFLSFCLGVTSPFVSGLEDPSKTSYFITPSSVSASLRYQSSSCRVCNLRAPSSFHVNRLPFVFVFVFVFVYVSTVSPLSFPFFTRSL